MMKPLSPKTLEKKYAELGLSEAKLRLLHTYFRCFSNLYGVISVREAWDVFKHYEGLSVHKRDFVAFSGVVQREAGLPYSVYELQEVFRDEESDIPQDRLIVNNDLVMTGYHRFIQIYATVERQEDKSHYLPEKSVFLSFVEDRFYLTPQGKDMASFVGNLRTGGTMRKHDKTPTGPLLDVYGKPVLGKRLSEFVFRTQMEAFEIEYFKDEHKKRKLEEEYTAVAADKLLKDIRLYIMTGGVYRDSSITGKIRLLVKTLATEYDVSLSEKQFEKFFDLFLNLNNCSNLWLNCGWRPDELYRREGGGLPNAVSVGPNLQKLFDSGRFDRAEFEKTLAEMGITPYYGE